MAKQDNKFKLLSYSFTNELPDLENPGETPTPVSQKTTELKGIQVSSGATEDTFTVDAPKFKGNRNLNNTTTRSLNYGGSSGLQEAEDKQYAITGSALASLAALKHFSGGNLATASGGIASRQVTIQLSKPEANTAANSFEGTPDSFSKDTAYIDQDIFQKDSATEFHGDITVPLSETDEIDYKGSSLSETPDTVTVNRLVKTFRKNDDGSYVLGDDGKPITEMTYKTETVNKSLPAEIDSKLEGINYVETGLREKETKVEFAEASKTVSMFSKWNTDEDGIFTTVDEHATAVDHMRNFSSNVEALGKDLDDFLHFKADPNDPFSRKDSITEITAGDTVDTAQLANFGISSDSIESLKSSKYVSYGKFLSLDHVQIDNKWDSKFWKQLFSKDTLTEIGASFTDMGAEIGAEIVNTLKKSLSFRSTKEDVDWRKVAFGEGISITKTSDGDKRLYSFVLGDPEASPREAKASSSDAIEGTDNGKYFAAFSSPYRMVFSKNSKGETKLTAVTGRVGSAAVEFNNKLASTLVDGTDMSYHLHELMSRDPLLSQYQYDLCITPRKDNPAFAPSSRLSSFFNDKGYMNYRITGITFPGNSRSAVSTHYGVEVYTDFPDLQAGVDHKAEITVLVDRDFQTLSSFLVTTGTAIATNKVDEKGKVAATYYDLGAVGESVTWNYDTNATIRIRNGRDLAKSLFFENPDWNLSKGVKVGTLKEVSGYDSEGYNPEYKQKDIGEAASKAFVTYNKLPVLIFKNFRIINTDFDFNFSSSNNNPFEVKLTVTWSAMFVEANKDNVDVYYAEPVSVKSATDKAVGKTASQKQELEALRRAYEDARKEDKTMQKEAEKAGKEQVAAANALMDYKNLQAAQTEAQSNYLGFVQSKTESNPEVGNWFMISRKEAKEGGVLKDYKKMEELRKDQNRALEKLKKATTETGANDKEAEKATEKKLRESAKAADDSYREAKSASELASAAKDTAKQKLKDWEEEFRTSQSENPLESAMNTVTEPGNEILEMRKGKR